MIPNARVTQQVGAFEIQVCWRKQGSLEVRVTCPPPHYFNVSTNFVVYSIRRPFTAMPLKVPRCARLQGELVFSKLAKGGSSWPHVPGLLKKLTNMQKSGRCWKPVDRSEPGSAVHFEEHASRAPPTLPPAPFTRPVQLPHAAANSAAARAPQLPCLPPSALNR